LSIRTGEMPKQKVLEMLRVKRDEVMALRKKAKLEIKTDRTALSNLLVAIRKGEDY